MSYRSSSHTLKQLVLGLSKRENLFLIWLKFSCILMAVPKFWNRLSGIVIYICSFTVKPWLSCPAEITFLHSMSRKCWAIDRATINYCRLNAVFASVTRRHDIVSVRTDHYWLSLLLLVSLGWAPGCGDKVVSLVESAISFCLPSASFLKWSSLKFD